MYIHNLEKEERYVKNERGNKLKFMTIVLQHFLSKFSVPLLC